MPSGEFTKVLLSREEHVVDCLFREMQVDNREADDRDKKCYSRGPLPSVRDEWVLQLDSQEYHLKKDVVEEDCNLGA